MWGTGGICNARGQKCCICDGFCVFVDKGTFLRSLGSRAGVADVRGSSRAFAHVSRVFAHVSRAFAHVSRVFAHASRVFAGVRGAHPLTQKSQKWAGKSRKQLLLQRRRFRAAWPLSFSFLTLKCALNGRKTTKPRELPCQPTSKLKKTAAMASLALGSVLQKPKPAELKRSP